MIKYLIFFCIYGILYEYSAVLCGNIYSKIQEKEECFLNKEPQEKPSVSKRVFKVISAPVYLLARPIDAFIDSVKLKHDKIRKENAQIAENSDLYSDFSVRSAENQSVSFREHVAVFRNNSLSLFDSIYNAVVIKISEKNRKERNKIKKDYKDVPLHPLGWQDDQRVIYKTSIWDVVLKVLDIFPASFALFSKFRSYLSNNVRSVIKVTALSLAALACAGSLIYYIHDAITEDVQFIVYIDGKEIGMIENKETLDNALKEAERYMSSHTGTDYIFSKNIKYELIATHDNTFVSEEQLSANIIDMAKERYVPAYVLYVDDTRVASSTSRSSLESVISSLKNAKLRQFTNSGVNANTVEISNTLKIEKLLCLEEEIYSAYDIYLMLNDSDDIRFYNDAAIEESEKTDEDVDVLVDPLAPDSDTAKEDNEDDEDIDISFFDKEDFESSNNHPQIDVNLVFSAVVNEEVYEPVAYETVYQYSEYYSIGTEFTSVEGQNGEVRHTYSVSYIDGKEVSRTLTSTEYVKEPVKKVVLVGIAEPISTEASGNFIYPVSGNIHISSYFGSYRSNTSYHYGVDITGQRYRPILASDGGVVIFAGNYSSYGRLVKIDHGNGYVTYYAHMQEICVEEGQRVHQGQIIGRMGDSGVASGVHVHFEIRWNNNPQDPLKFLPKY
ncbi:MAG: hypothetical protein E7623_02030 [Ruminococcaceae bacterium]|nr:hypothetical protein [Oscillospiraceae bacterium]